MPILKHILQYSNDGKSVDKEVILNQDDDSLEGLNDVIEYEYDMSKLTKTNDGFLGEWYEVEVLHFPYNRLYLKIESEN